MNEERARYTQWVKILQPLRQPDFARLAFAWAVSLLGDGFFLVAVSWQAYSINNEPAAFAVVGLATSTAIVLFALIGGWAGDRFDRRRIMIAADLLRAGAIGAAGVLSLTGTIEIWHLVIVGFLVGTGDIFFNPASTSLVPDLVESGQLPQANALRGAMRPLLMTLIGPAIGGVVVGAIGPGAAFLVDAASFLVSGVAVATIRTRPKPRAGSSAFGDTLREIGDGLRYARSTRWLWIALLSGALSLIFYQGPSQVLVPFLVKNELGAGPEALGLIYAFGGASAVVVSLIVGQLGLSARPVTAMYLVWGVCVLGLAGFGLMTEIWHGVLASMVTQAGFAWAIVIWITLLQRCVPAGLLGRVSSLDWLFSTALVPLSYALTGPVSDLLGPRATLAGAGVVGAVVSVAFLLIPGVRDPEVTGPFAKRATPVP